MKMDSGSGVIGVIPARWASTRLPGKPLAEIAGRPMILHTAERAARARSLDTVIVATDDQRIADVVNQSGLSRVKAVMTNPDHPSGTDRVAEAVASCSCRTVINIQGDEPLIDPGLIDRLADVMADGEWEMATAATPIDDPVELDNPAVVKVVFSRTAQALYFSRSVIPHVRDAGSDATGAHWRHIGIYAYRQDALMRLVAEPPCRTEQLEMLEQLRALDLGYRICILPVDQAGIGVDTAADLERVEEQLSHTRVL